MMKKKVIKILILMVMILGILGICNYFIVYGEDWEEDWEEWEELPDDYWEEPQQDSVADDSSSQEETSSGESTGGPPTWTCLGPNESQRIEPAYKTSKYYNTTMIPKKTVVIAVTTHNAAPIEDGKYTGWIDGEKTYTKTIYWFYESSYEVQQDGPVSISEKEYKQLMMDGGFKQYFENDRKEKRTLNQIILENSLKEEEKDKGPIGNAVTIIYNVIGSIIGSVINMIKYFFVPK